MGTGLSFAQCSRSPGEGFPSSSPPGRLAGEEGENRESERRRGGEGRVSWEEWAGSGANGPGVGPSDRMASSPSPGVQVCIIQILPYLLPGENKFPPKEKVSPSQSSFL